MENLSWLFYKGYYRGFGRWQEIDIKDKDVKRRIARFFEEKNTRFFNYKHQHQLASPGETVSELQVENPGLLFGSGYTHETGAAGEFKISLQLDFTTGQPLIPGSSVKGAIRAVFPQFEKDERKPWLIKNPDKVTSHSKEKARFIKELLSLPFEDNELYAKVHELEMHIFEGLNIEDSKDKGNSVYYSIYKRDIFHDALPVKGGDEGKIFGPDSITPHTRGPLLEPVPLLFLKVLPKVKYAFHFNLNAPAWNGIDGGRRVNDLYKCILKTTGLGAKTNVGYGQFK